MQRWCETLGKAGLRPRAAAADPPENRQDGVRVLKQKRPSPMDLETMPTSLHPAVDSRATSRSTRERTGGELEESPACNLEIRAGNGTNLGSERHSSI